MTGRDDLQRLAAYVCPQGRLCECQHPGGGYACPSCGCDCPLPGPDERSGDPDACPCCGSSIPL
ncbi:hypothetical protein Ato02nite_005270 [Paractinoplanes toevensis]|uniref:Uncharacterized protein n=1 Tax=Paractinoplanes toevensis TaxID=571911 RepID=A0A919T3L3_9ACTN|nr:hypothetical protein Ato02nite_005270 [Actinoplanes toevensis]